MQVSQESWLQTEISELVRQNPAKDSSYFSSLKPIVETWICRLNKESIEAKKEQVTAVASWIRAERTLNTHQMSFALYILERVCLSRRVSSLVLNKFYSRRIEDKKNHILKMKGLEQFLKTRFPEINLFTSTNKKPVNVDEICAKLEEKEVWVVVQMSGMEHKSLILIQKRDSTTVTIFDSLGLNFSRSDKDEQIMDQYKQYYLTVIQSIVGQIELVTKYYIPFQRQVDHVNCASYIASDLEIALQLLKEKKPLFTGETPHPLFYRTNQYGLKRGDSHVLPEYIIPHDENFEGNVLPTLIALDTFEALLRQASLSPKDHVEEGKSEEEIENCTIS